MLTETATTLTPQARFHHIDQAALSNGRTWATFETENFGFVTIEREQSGFLARSQSFDKTVTLGPEGERTNVVTYSGLKVFVMDKPTGDRVHALIDKMLLQCNSETRIESRFCEGDTKYILTMPTWLLD